VEETVNVAMKEQMSIDIRQMFVCEVTGPEVKLEEV
jgi:hypothetical protein